MCAFLIDPKFRSCLVLPSVPSNFDLFMGTTMSGKDRTLPVARDSAVGGGAAVTSL